MRTPQEAARRALALAVFAFRAEVEVAWEEIEREDRIAVLKDIAAMRFDLIDAGLERALTIRERKLLAKKPGDWPAQDATDASWSGENLVALLWSLQRSDLPPVWESSDDVVDHALGDMDDPHQAATSATLRPEDEVRRMADYLEAVRLRERTPDGFEGIPWLAGKAQEAGGDPPLDGDLPLNGKPYRLLDQATKNTVRSLALERHKALAWVLGDEDDLDAPAPEV